MNIDAILSMWDEDVEIQSDEIGEEARNIPRLHAKYLRMLLREKLVLKALEIDYRKLIFAKTEFMLHGESSAGALERKEWKAVPNSNRKVIKSDISLHLEADEDVNALRFKKDVSATKIEALNAIMDSIMKRGYLLNTIQKDIHMKAGVA